MQMFFFVSGAPGPQGSKGDQGLNGLKGEQGKNGVQGPAGESGTQVINNLLITYLFFLLKFD